MISSLTIEYSWVDDFPSKCFTAARWLLLVVDGPEKADEEVRIDANNSDSSRSINCIVLLESKHRFENICYLRYDEKM